MGALTEMSKMFKCLGEPNRLRIFNILIYLKGKRICGNELASLLSTHPYNISRNLKELRNLGLIDTEKIERHNYARLKPIYKQPFVELLVQAFKCGARTNSVLLEDIEQLKAMGALLYQALRSEAAHG